MKREDINLAKNLAQVWDYDHRFLKLETVQGAKKAKPGPNLGAPRNPDMEKKRESVLNGLSSRGIDNGEQAGDFLFLTAKEMLEKKKAKPGDVYSLMELASDHGGPIAQIGFAKALIEGTTGITSKEEGLSLLRRLVKFDSAEAAYLLYLLQQSYPESIEATEAKRCYETAQRLGYPLALDPFPEDFDLRPYTEVLVDRYDHGEVELAYEISRRQDIPKKQREAYFAVAITQENPLALEEMGDLALRRHDDKRAADLYLKAARKGKIDCYGKAMAAVNANPHFFAMPMGAKQRQEFEICQEGAKHNDPLCLTFLGMATMQGFWVAKDQKKAVALYKKAVKCGDNQHATYALAECYYKGMGVDVDMDKALKYLDIAAENGAVEAMQTLADIYENGLGVPRDHRLATKYRAMAGVNMD